MNDSVLPLKPLRGEATGEGPFLPLPECRRLGTALRGNVARALRGKEEAIEIALSAIVASGHVLVDDVPGVGKTTLAQALARSLGLSFARIQFTSDLLPGDVTGVSVFDTRDQSFAFKAGPLFANLVLADEINRTTPRTQSCLLEAMGEGQVSIDGVAHRLPTPFLVVATQNPHEHAGTYPLPESQLDRFLVRISLGYPAPEVERALLLEDGGEDALPALLPVASAIEVRGLQAAARRVQVAEEIADYALALVAATRASPLFSLGASPRGALFLVRLARARAVLHGRGYLQPGDVKESCVPCLAHRVVLAGPGKGAGSADRLAAERAVREIAEAVPVPE